MLITRGVKNLGVLRTLNPDPRSGSVSQSLREAACMSSAPRLPWAKPRAIAQKWAHGIPQAYGKKTLCRVLKITTHSKHKRTANWQCLPCAQIMAHGKYCIPSRSSCSILFAMCIARVHGKPKHMPCAFFLCRVSIFWHTANYLTKSWFLCPNFFCCLHIIRGTIC